MKNIMTRIADILESDIHALLNRCEDPEKMLEQNMRRALEELAELKESVIQLKADVDAAERSHREALEKVQAEHAFAVNAMKAGDETSAAKFLQSEADLKNRLLDPAVQNLNAAKQNFETVRAAHNKLASDIEFMKQEMHNIKGTIRTAKATEKVASMQDDTGRYAASFGKYAEKAQRMLDEANARMALNEKPEDELSGLREKYASGVSSVLSDRLADLRAECELPLPDQRGCFSGDLTGKEAKARDVMEYALSDLRKEAGVNG